jgi:UDP-N-acetylmuramoyl-L-alanyl-D-glutamate--2,6-diaminopimelate ligase
VFFVRWHPHFDALKALPKIGSKASLIVARSQDKAKITKLALKTSVIYVKDIEDVFLKALQKFYQSDQAGLSLIGVTGTNGKTTVTHLIHHILGKLKKQSGLIGTVGYYVGKKYYKPTHTTPDTLALQKLIGQMKKKKAKYLVMEVSSHGIDQDRIRGLKFSHCVFTNLSREHLDYHKTMSNYFKAKKKLFLHNRSATFILNNDDAWARKLKPLSKKVINFSINKRGDLTAQNIKVTSRFTTFDLCYKNKKVLIKTPLLGAHNVSNILAAIGVLLSLKIKLEKILLHIASFKPVSGRLERIGGDIFIDYAHTPDALENSLRTLKSIGYKKIVCVFGCGGDRDKGKRKPMGHISEKYADLTIITSDNPRYEDPKKIASDIKGGFKTKRFSIILDRKNAITKAVKSYHNKKDTCILVAGKGHEDYQIIKNKKLKFKDSIVIKKLINK